MIKAIETKYKGYRFRSRLEARYAVFFDALGVKWEYEKEGFDLGKHGLYLPDFWLPHLCLWVEIKGELTWETKGNYRMSPELTMCENFRNVQEWPIACVVGTPGAEQVYFYAWDVTDSSGGSYSDDDSRWCVSNGVVTLDVNQGRSDRVFLSDNLCGIDMPWFGYPYQYGADRLPIEYAYTAAKSARFEHGEQPNVH